MVTVAAVLGTTAAVRAQNATTGTLGGVVRDAQQGVLPGAGVVAVHAPTGTRYEAFTRADGRFDLLNAQVGPYDLEIALSGFGTQALSGVVVSLVLFLVVSKLTKPNPGQNLDVFFGAREGKRGRRANVGSGNAAREE